ncbi:RNA-binding cell elongation regulator Jag/EloR [Oscillibacter sp.]|jgi:spoIIIJ-associated protein|uniref:RNA-binding cell elongation regulator Jag/EloR n=1 Tax=Oscillibacter sp. TaxID=1945593 RepID=UPI0021740561|nr:RNA-binding cell elongation regulator Jag/EloR [Oscillibacter sp.]MCI9240794.1 protein jag [Oscillibacter sp.]
MRDYIDVTGKNEDEAISKALAQLNLDRDDVSVEVLERAKSGFLGLGACPAKIRVYYGPEAEEEILPPPPAPKPEPVREEPPKPRPAAPEKRERPERRERLPREKKELPEKKERPAPRPEPLQEEPPVPLGEEVDDEKAAAIKAFLKGLLEHMDSAAGVKVYLPEKGRYKVILEGQGLGSLIGRRGETLDAIQQLTSYAVNRGGGPRVRIHLDAENYRAKREQSLQHLARKVAGKVVRYRRSVTLEPMNAYERHVIHTALQDFEGVTTYSTGADPNRRVVVAPDRGERH